VIALSGVMGRVRPLIERLDALSLRERAIIFGAGVTLVFIAWQILLMDPLTLREKAAEQHLADAHRQLSAIDELGTASSRDPAVAAAARNHALSTRVAALDADLRSAAQGYIAPERMTDMLRALLAEQHGLKLVSLANLPVESLSQSPIAQPSGASPSDAQPSEAQPPGTPSMGAPSIGAQAGAIAPDDRGPFLHPVEIVVEGDYVSVVAYLRAIEAMPWRIHWRSLELTAGEYPVNRVRLVIGALSLSRDWINV
jgi:MSHA biogenesis protein MshJ